MDASMGEQLEVEEFAQDSIEFFDGIVEAPMVDVAPLVKGARAPDAFGDELGGGEVEIGGQKQGPQCDELVMQDSAGFCGIMEAPTVDASIDEELVAEEFAQVSRRAPGSRAFGSAGCFVIHRYS